MKTKREMYKTAKWDVNGEYVKLLKYFPAPSDTYEIETISGIKYLVWAESLSEFCL